jgi:hypothetical protein
MAADQLIGARSASEDNPQISQTTEPSAVAPDATYNLG